MSKPFYWMPHGDGARPSDMVEAAGQVGSDASRVARDDEGEDFVSTVFLYLDHDHGPTQADPNAAPVVFETMAYVGGEWVDQDRYRSRAAALDGHAALCRRWLKREPKGGAE